MQNNFNILALSNPQNKLVPLESDRIGTLSTGRSQNSALNLAASNVIKLGAGRVGRVNVIVAGSTVGMLCDTTTIGAAAISNAVLIIPAVIGLIEVDFPFFNGLVFIPGTGETVSISYI